MERSISSERLKISPTPMALDSRNVLRGKCTSCDECDVFSPQEDNVRCGYCDHVPVKHKRMKMAAVEEPPNEEDVCTSHVHVQSSGVISEGNVENSPKPLDESSSVITEENLVKDTEETEDQIFYSSGSCGPDIVEEVPAKEKESKTKQQSTLFQLFKSLKSTSSKQSKSGDYFYTNLDQINTADYEGDNTFLAPADQRTSSSETFARSTSVKSSDDESEHGDGESSDSAFLETSSSPTSSGQEPSFNTLLQTIDSHENDSSDIEIEEFTTPKFFKNKNAAKMEPTTSYKKSSTLQTSLTKTSMKDCKYPFAKSKNIKIYTEEEIENATGFEKQRRLFWNETAERMSKDPESRNWKKDAIHGAIDVHWTLAKSSVLRQEIRALESKLEQFNDTYEDIERNVLEKCNLYRNEDRVTAADRLVKKYDKKIRKAKKKIDTCFSAEERLKSKKNKIELEAHQKSYWQELKKAQDALRKSLRQAEKRLTDIEVTKVEDKCKAAEDADNLPPLTTVEEQQLAERVKDDGEDEEKD